jgi:hypothetical protein
MEYTVFKFIWYGVVILIFIYWFFFRDKAVIKRKLNETPEKKIIDFKDGDVARVKGSVKYYGKTITAPLSGRKCVYYHIIVEASRSQHSGIPSWTEIIEEENAGDVVINSGGNYALIQTESVKNYLIPDAKYSSGFFKNATETLEKFLNKHDKKSKAIFGINDTLRYKEGILEEGEIVTIVGKGKWVKKKEVHFNFPAEKILLIGPNDEEPVYFTDDPRVIDTSGKESK